MEPTTERVDIVKKDINIHAGPGNIAQSHVMHVLFRRRPLKYQLRPQQQCLKLTHILKVSEILHPIILTIVWNLLFIRITVGYSSILDSITL